MGIREFGLDQPLLTWYPISISKFVSNPYLGNLDNSVREKFLDDLCVIWGINNELSLDYWSNLGY